MPQGDISKNAEFSTQKWPPKVKSGVALYQKVRSNICEENFMPISKTAQGWYIVLCRSIIYILILNRFFENNFHIQYVVGFSSEWCACDQRQKTSFGGVRCRSIPHGNYRCNTKITIAHKQNHLRPWKLLEALIMVPTCSSSQPCGWLTGKPKIETSPSILQWFAAICSKLFKAYLIPQNNRWFHL